MPANDLLIALKLLLMLGVANGAPILGRRLLGSRFGWPLDGGLCFVDGKRVLGDSKTLRGLVAAIAASACAAPILGFDVALGARIGFAAMLGDALASFAKRRMGLVSGARCRGLDQVPESLLPLLAAAGPLTLSLPQIAAVTLAFYALELPVARLLFRLGIRERPY
jgi:hypothetical protein